MECPHLRAAWEYTRSDEGANAARPRISPEIEIPDSFFDKDDDWFIRLMLAALEYWRANPALTDPDLLAALVALRRTFGTRRAGLLYESRPEGALAAGLYTALQRAADEYRPSEKNLAPAAAPRDADWELATLALARSVAIRGNGRPRSRRCLEMWRREVGADVPAPAAGGLIVAP